MPRVSNKIDVEDTLEMLRMAHREWARNGLIPMEKGNEDVDYLAMRMLDAYRGVFPSSMPRAVDEVDEFVGNLVFAVVNSQMGQISARDPEAVIRPLGGTAADASAWRRAWLNQKVVQTLIREKKFRREADRALNCALLLPFGLVRHGYTPEIEEYENDRGEIITRFKNQTPDLPWVQFMRPWQVRIDPLVNNFDMDGEVGWIAFQNLYRSPREIDENPNLIDSKGWRATYHYDIRPMHERRKPRPTHNGIAGQSKNTKHNFIDMWEEWVIYDARRRTFYGVSEGSDKLVRKEADWPIDWGHLPASILTINEQLDSPFGISPVQMIWHEQMLYNKIWTVIKAIVNRVRRIVFVNGQAFTNNEGQLENLLNPDSLMEFIVADGGAFGEIAKEIQFGQLDGQLIGLLYQLKEHVREVLGVSSFDRGQRANVETAAEANLIGAGGQVAKSRIQAKFETFWVDLIRPAHRALLQTEDSRRFFIPVIGEENMAFLTADEIAQGFVEASLEDLQGEFDYGVKLNSTIPLDPAAEFSKLASVFQVVGGAQDTLTDQVEIRKRLYTLAGEDAQKLVIDRDAAQAMQQQGEQGSQQQGAPVQLRPAELAGVTGAA